MRFRIQIILFSNPLIDQFHRYFPDLYQFFFNEIEARGVENTIREYFPCLLQGIVGAAFHTVLHLGYGLSFHGHPHSDVAIAEGLAYLTYRYNELPEIPKEIVSPNPPQGLCDCLAIVSKVRNNPILFNAFRDEVNASLGYNDAATYVARNHGENLKNIVLDWKYMHNFPETESERKSYLDAAVSELVDASLRIYLFTNPLAQDFFLLHGVTATYAILQVLKQLSDFEAQLRLLQFAFMGILMNYVINCCPDVREREFEVPPNLDSWEKITEKVTTGDPQEVVRVFF